jgi:hypothetical protein
MKSTLRTLAAATLVTFTFAIPATFAQELWGGDAFVQMAKKSKDGMLSKADAMKMFEKMFDKADTKKMGKLEPAQVDTLIKMLAEASKGG